MICLMAWARSVPMKWDAECREWVFDKTAYTSAHYTAEELIAAADPTTRSLRYWATLLPGPPMGVIDLDAAKSK